VILRDTMLRDTMLRDTMLRDTMLRGTVLLMTGHQTLGTDLCRRRTRDLQKRKRGTQTQPHEPGTKWMRDGGALNL